MIPSLALKGGIFKLLRRPGINSEESILPAYVAWRPVRQPYFKFNSVSSSQSPIDCSKIPAKVRKLYLTYRPARLHRLAESIPVPL